MIKKVLEVQDLKKSYKGFVAVDRISFNVNRAEIFGFPKPNSTGKTTTINMLMGMAKVTSGKIFYNGTEAFINKGEIIKTSSVVNNQIIAGKNPWKMTS